MIVIKKNSAFIISRNTSVKNQWPTLYLVTNIFSS